MNSRKSFWRMMAFIVLCLASSGAFAQSVTWSQVGGTAQGTVMKASDAVTWRLFIDLQNSQLCDTNWSIQNATVTANPELGIGITPFLLIRNDSQLVIDYHIIVTSGEGEFHLTGPSVSYSTGVDFGIGCFSNVSFGSFATGRVAGLWVADATAPKVAAVTRAGTSPTGASSVSYVVRPAEFLSGLESADLTLTASGVTGATIGTVTDLGPANFGNMFVNGLNDQEKYIQLPSTTIITNFYADSNYTIEAWVKPIANGFWQRIFDFGNGAGVDNVLLALNGTTMQPTFAVYRGTAPNELVSPVAIPLGEWTHLAVSQEVSGLARLYINGVEVASATMHRPRQLVRSNNYLLKSNWSGDAIFRGAIDEFRFWSSSSVRTPAQIVADMRNTTPASPVDNSLFVYLQFESLQNLVNNNGNNDFDNLAAFNGANDGTGEVVGENPGPRPSSVPVLKNVTVNTGSGSGTLRLDAKSTGYTDRAGNAVAVGFTGGQVYNIDKSPIVPVFPTAPAIANAAQIITIDTKDLSSNVAEDHSGLVLADFVATNCTLSAFSAPNAKSVRLTVTPIAGTDQTATVSLPAGAFTDLAGNLSQAGSWSTRFDLVRPTVALSTTAPEPTNVNPITVNVVFSEAVTGFTTSDLTFSGTATLNPGGVISGSGTTYSFPLRFNGDGSGSVTINAGLVTDSATNTNVAATSALSRTYDSAVPVITLTTTAPAFTNVRPIPVAISITKKTFNETLTTADFVVTGGAVGALVSTTGPNSNSAYFTTTINPTNADPTDVPITVKTRLNAVTDSANNTSPESNLLSLQYDSIRPSVTVTLADVTPTNANTIRWLLDFTEPLGSFTTANLVVTDSNLTVPGNVRNLAGPASGDIYMLTVVPTDNNADGTVLLDLLNSGGSGVRDRAGNFLNTETAGSYVLDNFNRSNNAAQVGNGGGAPGESVTGPGNDSNFGAAVTGAGDINRDGASDFLISAPPALAAGRTNAGLTYVFRGTGTDLNPSGSSINTSAATVVTGATASDFSGGALTGIGDFDGDGFADFVIASPAANRSGNANQGEATIVYGRATMPASIDLATEASQTKLTGFSNANNFTGASISGAGDVDGDGLTDVIVGARGASISTGEAYLIYGRTSRPSQIDMTVLTGTNGFRILAGSSFGATNLGATACGAGDVNGDGLFDFLVLGNAPEGTVGTPILFLVYGSATRPVQQNFDASTSTNAVRFTGLLQNPTTNNYSGSQMGTVGDINGDGLTDFAVGDPSNDYGSSPNSGAVYVVYGSVSKLGALSGGQNTLNLPVLATASPDINSDGRPDGFMIVKPSLAFTFNGVPTNDNQMTNAYFGQVLTSAGDFNGDGFFDIAAASPGEFRGGGGIHVIFGSASRPGTNGVLDLTTAPTTAFRGFNLTAPGAAFGYSVSHAGDVNTDGFTDLVVGAPATGPSGNLDGAAYVLYGNGSATSAKYSSFMRAGGLSGILTNVPSATQFGPIGIVGDGSSNIPHSRVRMQFQGGNGDGIGGASKMDVTVFRTAPPSPANWPTWTPASVYWRIESDRETSSDQPNPDSRSVLIFNYHDREVTGFNLGKTKVFYTPDLNPTSTSCWIPVGDFIDLASRTARVERVHAPGRLNAELRGCYTVMQALDVIDLGREIASPWDKASCTRPTNFFPENPVRLRDGAGNLIPAAAFWHRGTQKLYAAQPYDPLVIEWLDTSTRVLSRQVVRTQLPTSDSEYQFHVANTPDVDLTATNPAPGGAQTFRVIQALYQESAAQIDASKLGSGRYAAAGSGRALLALSTGPDLTTDPIYFVRMKTVQWSDATYLTDNQSAPIGTEIRPPAHDFTLGSPWAFFKFAHYNAMTEKGYYDRDARTGPFIPVNLDQAPVEDDLVPVAYQRGQKMLSGTGAMLATPGQRSALSLRDHEWPWKAYRYDAAWPANAPQIVIASGIGSGALDPEIYDTNWEVYVQNNPAIEGFNPNEEHALIAPVQGVNGLFALRNDLNTPTTSQAYALINYTSPVDGLKKMAVWRVLDQTAEIRFSYSGVAGTALRPVYPIDFLGVSRESTPGSGDGDRGVSGPYWSDKRGRFWARAAGENDTQSTIVMRWFYENQPGFFYPYLAANAQPAIETNIPLLDRRPGGTNGVPIDLTYTISWPLVVPEMFSGETLVTQKRGLPNISGQCSVDILYQESVELGTGPSVTLIDPVRTSEVTIETLPPEIKVEDRGGKLAFTDLSPTLKERIRYDLSSRKLILTGKFIDRVAGEDFVLLNLLTELERTALRNLSTNATWRSAVNALRTQTIPADSLSEFKALTASFPRATGYVTLAMQNSVTPNACRDAPVSLEIIRVVCPLYDGELVVIPPDCVFDERMTMRHTADLAGRAGDYSFEWWTHPDENGTEPAAASALWRRYTPRPADGQGANELVLGEGDAAIFVLSDNWFKVRYKPVNTSPVPACGVEYSNYSPGQLAPGWIKRVLNQIDPFQQRFIGGGLDSAESRFLAFKNNQINTTVSMIGQAGPPWAGSVPLNCNNIDQFGLIEIYQTVLNRARTLSIDASPNVDNSTVNAALLLVSGRLADLYMLLGNEAYADASDPTIGFSTNDASFPQYGNQATSIHAFMNQTGSLLEEELTLLRGRSAGPAPGTQVYPVFNRLFWNFTSDIVGGEVAYALNYNIQDASGNVDGEINAADAARLYPQGHGDAWGHYLTAMQSYYRLLQSPSYTWTPRAEAVLVAGQPVTVDFLDERKFAIAAAAKARTGAEIVNLTFRSSYDADPAKRWKGFKDEDPDRAWGLTEWGSRAGQGAYFDWVTANAIIPAIDSNPSHTEPIQKVDRQSVFEIDEIAAAFSQIQTEVAKADAGLNPLGLAPGVVPFDIDPAAVDQGKTHFDQIYARALGALSNAVLAFDNATASTQLLRRQNDSLSNFQRNITNQEADFTNRLTEVFGRPYPEDIGPGGAYPSGYEGPDLQHWMYVDRNDYDPSRTGPPDTEFSVTYTPQTFNSDGSVSDGTPVASRVSVARNVRRLVKPSGWTTRSSPGELQVAMQDMAAAQYRFRASLQAYNALLETIDVEIRYNLVAKGIRAEQVTIRDDTRKVQTDLAISAATFKTAGKVAEAIAQATDKGQEIALEYTPKSLIFGFAGGGDLTSPIRGTMKGVAGGISTGFKVAAGISAGVADALSSVSGAVGKAGAIKIEDKGYDLETKERFRKIEVLLVNEQTLRLEMFTIAQELEGHMVRLQSVLAKGNRVLSDRARFRLQSAGQVQDYRYKDMAFRIFRNDALQKYRAQYDLAATYTYLAAKAYDYETNLIPGTSANAGGAFLAQVVKSRSLGTFIGGQPQTGGVTGDPGLSDSLARMSANWAVLSTQLGFNNPTREVTSFSLRKELYRIPDGTQFDADWRGVLERSVSDDILSIPEFRRYAVPFTPTQATEPGFVFRFGTNIAFGSNFFNYPLAPGESQYSSAAFATKLRAVAVTLDEYNSSSMGATPYVYLIPVGADIMRSPLSGGGTTIREWRILDQILPVPFALSPATLANDPDYVPIIDSLNGSFAAVRRIGDFRAYPSSAFSLSNLTTSSRLIGRSAWNSEWLLIIPAGTLLNNRQTAIDRFINDTDGSGVTDINLVFSTYSFTGNLSKSAKAESAPTLVIEGVK